MSKEINISKIFAYDMYGILTITLIALILVIINVLLHFEVLNFLSKALAKISWAGRARIAILIPALLLSHIVEIWIFAAGMVFSEMLGDIGYLKGALGAGLLDYVYYSAMTYTTVG